MSDMNCPYCQAPQDVCHDDGRGYAEDQRHEHECTKCERWFVFTTWTQHHYSPSKADCLNGWPHDLEISSTYPRRFSKMQCKNCDFERTPTAEEFSIAGINTEESP